MTKLFNNRLNEVKLTYISSIEEVEMVNGNIYISENKWSYKSDLIDEFPEAIEVWMGEFYLDENQFGKTNFEFLFCNLGFGVWVHQLNEGKIGENIYNEYHKMLGIDYITKEQAELQAIIASIGLLEKTVIIHNTSQQLTVFPNVQLLGLTSHKAKKRAEWFYEDFMQQKVKKTLRIYPDLIIEYPPKTKNGKTDLEFYELELGFNKKKLFEKLFKFSISQRIVNFIIADYAYDFNRSVIEEFILLPQIKFDNIYICTLSEFRRQGIFALERIQ